LDQRGVSEAPAVRDDTFASESFFGLLAQAEPPKSEALTTTAQRT
jgi:hypothetical protein